MKKLLKRAGFVILPLLLVILGYVAITFPPVMAGMAAKTMCSCVFVSGRTPESVREKEMQVFPGLASAEMEVNSNDSTASATIFWKTSKAIFRKGLGCTLLSERTEQEVRSQSPKLAPTPPLSDTIDWPTGNPVDSLPPLLDKKTIDDIVGEAFHDSDSEKPAFTHAVIAVYDGKIIAERYADGFDERSILMGWSMTKSITNALVGILVHEGKLSVNNPAPVAEWQHDDRRKITINNLLQATSGLTWQESYFIPTSTFHNMFIKSDDKGSYAAGMSLVNEPGQEWKYSSGSCNILSKIIRQTVGDDNYYKFPYEKLFFRIGMNNTLLEPDASGTFVGSSYCYGTARDWARFGLLYLNDGVWNGERILPEGWVKYSTTPASADQKGKYGALWWLNHGPENEPSKRLFPDLPGDMYMAEGFESQYVMVIPSNKLVIVRLGVSHHGFNDSKLAAQIIEELPDL